MDEDFVQHYCMVRNIIIQICSTISPPTPQQTQQETLSLDDVNHNLQTYFIQEWDIRGEYCKGFLSL